MIIDAHAHAAREYSTVESILDMVQNYKMERIVLCTSVKNNLELREPPNLPVRNSPNSIYFLNQMLRISYKWFMKDFGDGNRYVYELRNKIPNLIIQFLWVNPLDKQHMNNLERNIQSYQVKGIKLHQAWNPFSIDGPEFGSLVELARAYKLPVFIHLYSKKETRKLSQFLCENKDVVFIIAHLLGLSIFKERRGELGNVYFDTSGSDRIQGRDILEAINSFGYEHVIFGTDMPFARIGHQIDKIQGLKLSDKVKEYIFSLNIKNVLSLGA